MFNWISNWTQKVLKSLYKKEAAENALVNVSEPILSFIATFKENPRRFKFGLSTEPAHYGLRTYYTLEDTVSKESWKITGISRYRFDHPEYEVYTRWPEWMTKEERDYVLKELSGYYEGRRDKLRTIRSMRTEQKNQRERNRLKSIYCKEEV